MTLPRRLALAAAVVFGLGLAASLLVRVQPVASVDLDATRWLHDRAVESETVAGAALDVTNVGDPITLAGLVAVVAGWLLVRRHGRTALWLVAVTAAAAVVESSLKIVVGRSRPDFDSALVETVTRSFPSGHAMNTTVVIGAITVALVSVSTSRRALAVPVVSAVAVAVALTVGLTRPLLGVHHVSDIFAGWILGVVWLVLVRPRSDAEVRAEPEPASA